MLNIYEKALELLEAGRRVAFAVVVHATGSTPQKPGAKALFEPSGPVHGTLGGGCLEAEARQRAFRALDSEQPLVFDLKLDEVDGWDDGLVCGGRVRIFVDPNVSRNAAAYRMAFAAQARGAAGVLVLVIEHPDHAPGTALWLDGDALHSGPKEHAQHDTLGGDSPPASPASHVSFAEPLRQEIAALLSREQAGLVRVPPHNGTSGIEVFVEPVLPPPRLVIAGAGHIGKALARLGAWLGFHVTLIDDRPSFAHAAHVPDAHTILCGDIAEELQHLPLDARTYVVIVTRGHRHDGQALAACIHAPVAYLGLIGSKRKSLLLRRRLLADGLASEEEVARVVSPMGLDIGGTSVEEIALSIAAQLVAVRRRKTLEAAPLALPLTP
ncbi:MAG: XdhC family protein [Candidatus Hydrogenedentes bacterium]|nr:XdhC family protein [Candidatus Hydrogenedentota bacterium]